MIVFLCHRCKTNTEPFEGVSGGFCEMCGSRLTHYITWTSPAEDRAAALLIKRELALGVGGWCGSDRAQQALKDAGL